MSGRDRTNVRSSNVIQSATKVDMAPLAWENELETKSPAGAPTPTGQSDQLSNREAETEVTLNEIIVDPVTRRKARDQAITLLHAATSQAREAKDREHAARVNLDRYIALCKFYGIPTCDIQDVTGLSSSGVGLALSRARDLDGRQESGVA